MRTTTGAIKPPDWDESGERKIWRLIWNEIRRKWCETSGRHQWDKESGEYWGRQRYWVRRCLRCGDTRWEKTDRFFPGQSAPGA